MNTQTIRASALQPGWTFPSFGRFFAILKDVLDVYSEALEQAHEVRQRYPFASE